MSSPRVLVLQNGARHNYSVPAVLARSGMLEAFYTDACGNVGLGRLASAGRFLPLVAGPCDRLHHRQVPEAVRPRTTAFFTSQLADGAARLLSNPNRNGNYVAHQMIRRGLGKANVIYSSLGWGRSLLKTANSAGIPVVTEFYVRPSIRKTYQDEYRAFPGWESELPMRGFEDNVGSERDPCTVSDFVVAPAEAVAQDVASIHGFPRERITVIPYGIEERFFRVENRPIRGRILFAGTCCLGKGIHYLAFAAELLASRGYRFEFRVAGDVTPLVRGQNACRHLTFLGRVARLEFWREYELADVVVIPSLSEGFSTVGLQALAAGVPVVATRAACTVVRDGIDGYLIPERDPGALANAVAQIVEDRRLREQMSNAARERAREYTWDRYGERLIAALRDLPGC